MDSVFVNNSKGHGSELIEKTTSDIERDRRRTRERETEKWNLVSGCSLRGLRYEP